MGDAFAKEIYSVIFHWLLKRINKATSANTEGVTFIGLLDIFGFEIFDQNFFEQLCINHANEKLQKKFIQDVFEAVKIEYAQQDIMHFIDDEIKYDDNSFVIDFIEGKMGVIRLLNEE